MLLSVATLVRCIYLTSSWSVCDTRSTYIAKILLFDNVIERNIHAQEKRNNKQCLLKILSKIDVAFLAQQGLAFRGDDDEVNSNFVQLLQLHGLDQ